MCSCVNAFLIDKSLLATSVVSLKEEGPPSTTADCVIHSVTFVSHKGTLARMRLVRLESSPSRM